MAWTGLTLTVDGQNALNKAQISNKMNIKSMVIGDGAAPQNFRTLTALVNQLYEITDLKIDVVDEKCTITADFPQVDFDYYFREIGVIVTTDEGDKLYVYDNCGDDAQYIVNSTGVETTKKRIRISLIISDVAEITVSTPGTLYVSYDDFEKEIQEIKDDKVSSDGGDISDTTAEFEEPEELQELVNGENVSSIFGKLKLAVKNLKTLITLIGTTDISSIGGGTVTGAISALNSNLVSSVLPESIITSMAINKVVKNNNSVFLNLLFKINENENVPQLTIIAVIPEGYRPTTVIYRFPATLRNSKSGNVTNCYATISSDGGISIDTSGIKVGYDEISISIVYINHLL